MKREREGKQWVHGKWCYIGVSLTAVYTNSQSDDEGVGNESVDNVGYVETHGHIAMCLGLHVVASPLGIVGLSAKIEWLLKLAGVSPLTVMEKMSAGMPRNNEVMLRMAQMITSTSVTAR